MSVDRKHLRKLFKQLADLLVDEADRNPDFEIALTEIFNLPDDKSSGKGKIVEEDLPDPFEAYSNKTPEAFEEWLKTLSVEELRGIVRLHRFDSAGRSNNWKTPKKLIELISQRVAGRAKQGTTFRQYGSDTQGETVSSQVNINEHETEPKNIDSK